MAFSRINYTGNGSTVNYTFSFPYLNKADIYVFVAGVSVPYTFLNTSTVTCTTVPASGATVQIRRSTQKTTVPVDFTDGSVLLEKDLDLLASYTLYAAQEADDTAASALRLGAGTDFDATSLKITNLTSGVLPTDAVNKGQLDATATPSAATSASNASASASNAATSASNASTSASNAAAILANTVSPTGVQSQVATAFTTTGTSAAYVLTPVPAITAYAANQRFRAAFHVSGSGSSTVSVSGLAAKSVKQYTGSGVKTAAVIASGQLADIEYDGVDLVILNPLQPLAGTGPCFSAYQSTAQSIAAGASVKVSLQTKEFDTANAFDAAANYRFTPLVAGYYQCTAAWQANGTTITAAYLYKNGSAYKNGNFAGSNSPNQGASVASLIYLNGSTDYVEFWLYSSSALSSIAVISSTYFNGFLARSA